MSQLLILFYEFFKIGLFSIGGGLATLPFLYRLADRYEWLSSADIADMIAVSESTPGPLGVNMATYAGFQCMGVLGSVVATFALVLPSVIVIILVYRVLEKVKNSPVVEDIFYTLRPTVTGLIGAAGLGVIVSALFHTEDARKIFTEGLWHQVGIKELLLFIGMIILTNCFPKIHPILFIALGAVVGVVFAF